MSLKNLFAFLVVLGLVFSAPVGTPIRACQEISAPGEYYLDQSISGLYGAEFYCIRISTGDVIFDCNGYEIQGLGTGYGIEIKSAGAPNITVKNCNVYNYNYGLYGDPKGAIISNNIFRRNNNYGMNLQGSLNTLEYNNVSENSVDGAYIAGDNNTIRGNRLFSNRGEGIGLTVKGNSNVLYNNIAYDNYGEGFSLSGNKNEVYGNTAYGNDWEQYQGGGFDLYGYYNNIHDNVAYDNTNGFYIAGPLPRIGPLSASVITTFGNRFVDNHAYNNLIGLNAIDNNGTYTDNVLEENLEADFLVGGEIWFSSPLSGGVRSLRVDPTSQAGRQMCDNIFDNIGSGGRDIYFTNKTVTLSGGTYSEVVICDADGSTISGVTVSGSNTLDNNGMLLFFTEDATIKSSNSKDNFMGFGFVQSDRNELESSNSDGSGIGVASAVSKDLQITKHTSKNNKMNSTIFWDLLMMVVGGPLAGEPARAPVQRPDAGAGAIFLMSPRAVFSGSSFSESTAGALFLMSDEVTIESGGAFENDLFGYGFVDSYNGVVSGSIYGNDGNLRDIFGNSIPGGYESLELLPLGAGVIDISINTLGGLPIVGSDLRAPSTCRYYAYCDMDMGYICDFDSGNCTEGTFENRYENARVYENNYGLVLLSRGQEAVDGCRIYDNNVLGILDASYTNTGVFSGLGVIVDPVVSQNAITVTRTMMYRNGEQVFATMADLFEEAGMEGWYDAFSLLDRSIPKGVLEFELIEASYLYEMGPILLQAPPEAQGVPWQVNHSTVGAGTSSVEFSVEDNASAVYIVSDTTLPSVRVISIEDRDLGLDLTVHFQNGGVKNKSAFYNKYFLVGAIGENPDIFAPTPVGPQMSKFQVHYGSPSGYDAETMGLYTLSFYRQAWYCDEDEDCTGGNQLCYENMCVVVECRSDSDCNVLSAATQYCVGYECSECRDDTDCRRDLTACRQTDSGNRCASEFCIYDSECPVGQYCDMTKARCVSDIISGPRSSAPLPISEIANREVAIRAPTPSGDAILRGRWVPVPLQSNSVAQRTITVTPFIQGDRTGFIEDFFGDIIPEEYRIYGEVYGLFATRVPGAEDKGEPATYVCEQDSDCGECEYCSIDNNMCLPKEAAQCGVPNKECREGYTCSQCSCMPPECTTDSQCAEGYNCLDYSCTEKPVEEKPPEEKPPEETPTEPGTPPVEEVTPEEPEEEKPTYPLVEVEVPSVRAPQQPVSASQAEFQTYQIGLVFLLLIGLVAAYLWFKTRGKGKKGK